MAGVSILAFPATAFAQIDEVVTTAQRRSQNVQDVPIAVSVFTPEDLVEKQIDEPLDLANFVPNFHGVNNTGVGSANAYYIRGQGNSESIATFDPPVGTYVDEVYIARQNANNVAFFDVEGIEVLRGPQGTLFGRNTTGGAVVTRMKKPSEEAGGYIELEYGSYERMMARGSIDMPINEKLLSKVSGFVLDEDGYVDNIATGETLNGQSAIGIRGDLRAYLSSNVRWDVSADYTEDESANVLNYGRGGNGLNADGDLGDRVSNSGISTASGTGSLYEQLLAGKGLGVDNKGYSLTSNLQYDLTDGAINFIAGYRSLDQDFIVDFFDGGLAGEQFATGGFAIANSGEHDQLSLELKYESTYLEGALNVISGLYYFTEDNRTDFADVFTVNVSPPPGIIPFPITLANRVIDNELESYAAYAQGDYSVSEDLTLTVGLRWTEEIKDFAVTDAAGAAGPLNTENVIAAGIGTKLKKSLVTPRFVVNYDISENVSTFASATKGFKSGGWNARGTSAALLAPFNRELVWNYEAGLRSVLLDNTLSMNATLFYQDTSDLQTPSAFVDPSTGAISFITQNFADLENKGIELDFNYKPNEALNIFASAGFQDIEYSSVDQSIATQAAACAAGDSTQGGLGIVAPDCSIGEPVRSPDYTISLGGSYNFAFGNGWNLTPSANARFVGSAFTGTSNLPNGFQDSYTLVNAGLTLSDDDGLWRLTAECKNCLDEAFITNNLPPTRYFNDPVRWQIGLRRNF